MSGDSKLSAPRRAVLVVLAVVVLSTALAAGLKSVSPKNSEYQARFPRAVGLYEGSPVSVLGVQVGDVTSINPDGTSVVVTFELSTEVDIPADARAVIVAPTLVSDRKLELTPVYDGGPVLRPGSEIPLERTAVPVEIDQILGAVQEVSSALGPQGANRSGALDELVRAGARVLDGNGRRLNATVSELSAALDVTAGSGDELAVSLTNLAQLSRALVASDRPVRRLAATLQQVSASLAVQREALVGTVDGLALAMREVRLLVRESGPSLTRNVAGLLDVTRTLLKEEQALRETLNTAPVALQNFIGTFDPQTSALTARIAVNGTLTTDPSLLLCQLISSNGLSRLCPVVNGLVDPIEPLLQSLPQPLGEGAEIGDGTYEGPGRQR